MPTLTAPDSHMDMVHAHSRDMAVISMMWTAPTRFTRKISQRFGIFKNKFSKVEFVKI